MDPSKKYKISAALAVGQVWTETIGPSVTLYFCRPLPERLRFRKCETARDLSTGRRK